MSFKILKSQKERRKCTWLVAGVQKEFCGRLEGTDCKEDRKLYMMVSTHFTVQQMSSIIQRGAWVGHGVVYAGNQE